MSYTPGPWLIDADGDIQSSTGDKLADMHITTPENRQVMVAGAEMLEALKDAAQYLSYSVPDDHPVMAKVDAAIAKAEGRNP